MKIRFLGTHNTASRNSRYTCFLVDETLAVDAGSIASALTFEEQAKIEAVLLSHGHYDHIRELPALAFNTASSGRVVKVFATQGTLKIFATHLADGQIYPEFIRGNSHFGKVLEIHEVQALQPIMVTGYRITAFSVPHPASAVGYEISDGSRTLFYTGDSGPGLRSIWPDVSPNMLIAEMTFPNRLTEKARASGHLCPALLRDELDEFRSAKGYLPLVSLVHRSPEYEAEIERDVRETFKEWQLDIRLSSEGDEVVV